MHGFRSLSYKYPRLKPHSTSKLLALQQAGLQFVSFNFEKPVVMMSLIAQEIHLFVCCCVRPTSNTSPDEKGFINL